MNQDSTKASVQRIKSDFRVVCNRAAEPTLIVGSKFELPEDGWVPFLRLGEFPVKDPSAEIQGIQVVDEEAAQAIVKNRGSEELLLDFDHFSRRSDKPTEAAGWIQGFEIRDTNELDEETGELIRERHVYANIRWSKAGRESVEGGNYRYISPDLTEWEFLGDGRMRPNRAVGGGLTNRTAITGQKPVSNRNTEQETKMDYKQILIGLLGLAAEATDQVITNRAEEFKTEIVSNREAAEKVSGLEQTITTQAEQLVEGDLTKYAAVITNRDAVKAALLKDRPGTLAMLGGLKAPENSGEDKTKTVVFNRDTAKPPKDGVEEANAQSDKRAAVISNRANELLSKSPDMSLSRAYQMAQAEIDEKE